MLNTYRLPALHRLLLSCWLVLLILLCSASPAFASGSCSLKEVPVDKIRTGLQASSTLEKWLNSSGAQVAIIARQGQSLAKYGIQFSHAAFAIKDPATHQWTVYHQLNECPRDTSAIYEEGLGMFFMNDPESFLAAAVIPTREVQNKLIHLLKQPSALKAMHDSRYSAVAYPFATENQNSNGWLLELFAQAMSPENVNNRENAQQWLKDHHYQPATIRVSGIKRFMANHLVGNISLNGQPQALLNKGELWINSADETLNFIAKYSLLPDNCQQGKLNRNVCMINTLPNSHPSTKE